MEADNTKTEETLGEMVERVDPSIADTFRFIGGTTSAMEQMLEEAAELRARGLYEIGKPTLNIELTPEEMIVVATGLNWIAVVSEKGRPIADALEERLEVDPELTEDERAKAGEIVRAYDAEMAKEAEAAFREALFGPAQDVHDPAAKAGPE